MGVKAKERKEYQLALVKIDSPQKVDSVEKKIKEMGFQTFSLKDILKGVKTMSLIIQAVLGGLGAIALMVAALGIANTMTRWPFMRELEKLGL